MTPQDHMDLTVQFESTSRVFACLCAFGPQCFRGFHVLMAALCSVGPAVFLGLPPTQLLPPEAWQKDRRETETFEASAVKMLSSRSSLIFGRNDTSAQRKRFGADRADDVGWWSNHLDLHPRWS